MYNLHDLETMLIQREDEAKDLMCGLGNNRKDFVIKYFKKVQGVRRDEKVGGAKEWPLWMLQLVLEMLINGTPPSVIVPNIASHVKLTMSNVKIEDLLQ